MNQKLTGLTMEVLEACLGNEKQRQQITERLENELTCKYNPSSAERITISIIRIIFDNCEKDYADVAFEIANRDWRDLFLMAGHGYAADSHLTWANTMIRDQPRVELQSSEPKGIEPDENGWTRCPNCNFRFKITDPNAFDGKRHRRCSQKLHVIAKTS